MFNFIVKLLKTIFSVAGKKRKDVIFTMLLLKKENEIMKRHFNLGGKKITSNHSDRFFLSLIAALSKRAINHLTIVKPETLLEWQLKRFLKTNWDSLLGMDFMTIDTLFGKRFYLLIIMELKSRRIIRYDLTENPCREFVKQRVELFSNDFPHKKTLIYDNASQFTSIDYSWFGIK
jgi:transposase InsO family protein